MALKTFVKINRVTNLTDARFCAGMNVDVIGFSLEADSEHFLNPSQFKEITGWISGIELAAEFKNASSSEIMAILENYPNISWIESENLETLIELQTSGLKLIYKQPFENVVKLKDKFVEKIKKHSISVHLTSQNNHSIPQKHDLAIVFSKHFKVILGFGITPETVENLLSSYEISGLALDSGDEIKTGLRDFDKLADILEILEVEE
jgi:phosphoribosylanthranilate isomerase